MFAEMTDAEILNILQISAAIVALVIAVVLHELAHAYVALRLGDPTAKDLGRITLNPIKHIDWFWTIIFPAILVFSHSPVVFGAAKPVPVNPLYFKKPLKGMMWVALAGPVINFILAIIAFLLLSFMKSLMLGDSLILTWFVFFLIQSVFINVVLGIFNLMPVPPLDGSRILVGLLPEKLGLKLTNMDRFGFVILIGLLYFKIHEIVLNPIFNFLDWVIQL